MAVPRLQTSLIFRSAVAGHSFLVGQSFFVWQNRQQRSRPYATGSSSQKPQSYDDISPSPTVSPDNSSTSNPTSSQQHPVSTQSPQDTVHSSMPPGWEDDPNYNISAFSELPHRHFGFNQHMIVNAEFKEALRQVLWKFRAPIRYAFAYGSGVFSQGASETGTGESPHPHPPEAVKKWQEGGGKTIDFIFGVTYTQHWHSLNLQQNRDHYSLLGSLGSGVVSRVQDNMGAGAYFNPYITVNGMQIKYGVVNLDTIYRDLSEWDTLYIAGRLQKPVKILRDDPRIRLANQVNLISAVRVALLMLPSDFTEEQLYAKIAGISYMGDPRMSFGAESPSKVKNIVKSQMVNFRQLYYPLIDNLPNVDFNDPECKKEGWMSNERANCKLQQDMDPVKRGNMVRRLPKAFRKRLYDKYQGVFNIPTKQFEGMLAEHESEDVFSKRTGGEFDQKIASEEHLDRIVADVVKQTVTWPTVSQTFKGVLTAGVSRGMRYFLDKRKKGKARAKDENNNKENAETTKGGQESQKKENSDEDDRSLGTKH